MEPRLKSQNIISTVTQFNADLSQHTVTLSVGAMPVSPSIVAYKKDKWVTHKATHRLLYSAMILFALKIDLFY